MSFTAVVCTEHNNCTIVDGEHKENPRNPLADWTEQQLKENFPMYQKNRQTGELTPVKIHTPILAVIDDEVALEALNDNVIILEDPFRTGFECKACDGEGHTEEKCKTCGGLKVVAINKDFNVNAATLTEADKKALPPHFVAMMERKAKEQEQEKIVSGGLEPCSKCIAKDKRGNSYITGFEQCKICKGLGSSIIVPEDTMRRPTSGIVKSLGPLCKFLHAGDRVVFSNMMGHAISYTHKTVFRTMREDEIMMRLHGTNPEKFQRKLS